MNEANNCPMCGASSADGETCNDCCKNAHMMSLGKYPCGTCGEMVNETNDFDDCAACEQALEADIERCAPLRKLSMCGFCYGMGSVTDYEYTSACRSCKGHGYYPQG
jgi:hypothetical protein